MADLKEKRQRPPTERQVEFASAIAERLNIRLPRIRTRQSLFLFIRDNRPKFEKSQAEKGWNWTDCLDREEDADMAEAMGIDILTGGLDDD